MKIKRSLKGKLQLAFGLLLAAIIFQGAVSSILSLQLARQEQIMLRAHQDADEVSDILSSHYEWFNNITMSAFTGSSFTGSLDSGSCSLGQWLQGDYARNATPEELALLERVQRPHSSIHATAAELMAKLDGGTLQGGEMQQVFLDSIKPDSLETIGYLKELKQIKLDAATAAENKIVQLTYITTAINFATMALCALTAVCCTVILIRSTVPPLLKMIRAAEKMAVGDTDVDLLVHSNDEIGVLSQALSQMALAERQQVELATQVADGNFVQEITPRSPEDGMSIALNKMVREMSYMMAQVRTHALQVSTAADQLADNAQLLAQGAAEQSSSIEALSQSVSNVAENTSQNAQIASDAAQLGKQIQSSAHRGTRLMEELEGAVTDISASSTSISKVIKAIDDIAFQTNILSLNAAVEAARAGHQGRGFAVVADEVRNLAAKSAEAAKDTGTLIKSSIDKAATGARLAKDTSKALREIVDGIDQRNHMVEEIAYSSNQQSIEIQKIDQGIEQVAMVVSQNSANSEETASASEQLSCQSDQMTELLRRFRLKEEPRESSGELQAKPVPAAAVVEPGGFALIAGEKY